MTTGRRWVRQTLIDWGLADLAADAELAVSELLSNVVRHTATAATVVLEYAEAVVVTVTDGDAQLPMPHEPVSSAGSIEPGGQGLRIVAAVSSAWGVRELPEGKAVWFRLDLPGAETPEAQVLNLAGHRSRTEPPTPRPAPPDEVVTGTGC